MEELSKFDIGTEDSIFEKNEMQQSTQTDTAPHVAKSSEKQ